VDCSFDNRNPARPGGRFSASALLGLPPHRKLDDESRLEPGAKKTWHEKLAAIQKIVDTKGESQAVWMTVELGTGKVLRTKQTTLVAPSNDG
jgi:hypothetical protein